MFSFETLLSYTELACGRTLEVEYGFLQAFSVGVSVAGRQVLHGKVCFGFELTALQAAYYFLRVCERLRSGRRWTMKLGLFVCSNDSGFFTRRSLLSRINKNKSYRLSAIIGMGWRGVVQGSVLSTPGCHIS